MSSFAFAALTSGTGIVLVLIARFVLLRLAVRLQARAGYSDQFVTEVAVALPIAVFVLFLCGIIAWMSQ